MPRNQIWILLRVFACLLILKTVVVVIANYADYLPPDFASAFLGGRERYFFGAYRWAFYSHIFAGPVSLALGLVLLSDRFRSRFLRAHRILGRLQAMNILGIVVPSGLWLAAYAETGAVAGVAFAMLAVATGLAVAQGWQAAVQRRIIAHRQWMWRGYVLLCSAVTLRILGGLVTLAGFDSSWSYPLSAWISWLIPLGVLETIFIAQRRSRVRAARSETSNTW